MNMHDAFINALFDPEQALPANLSQNPGNRARFAVYRNNVRASLTDALADTFPVCRQLVGDAFFRAMAGVYIEQTPPDSPLLTDYGHRLPTFIDSFPPASAVPYLADMARLEWAWLGALHAAEPDRLDTRALAALLADEQRVAGLQLQLQPSARLLRSPYAVISLWRAHQGQLNIADVNPFQPEQALLLRPALQVELLPLDKASACFIELLLRQPLGAALEQTLRRHPDFAPEQTLALLLRHQAIAAFHPDGDVL